MLKQGIKWLMTIGISLTLSACIINPPPPPMQTLAFPPPVSFNGNGLKEHPTPEEVRAYQDALLKYIRYLEQYYISIGVYYGGDTSKLLSNDDTNTECHVIEGIFRDIPLPKPPTTDDRYINETMNNLIDHITELRQRIRSNNLYMSELRKRYRGCK